MTTTWTWKSSPDLMARLSRAQNHPANIHIDIMTCAGWCDDAADLLRHVERYERAAAEYVAPVPVRRRRAA